MKKFLYLILGVALLYACSDDDYSESREPVDPEEEIVMAKPVDGRVALGYVTYYGKNVPTDEYLTHVNYAFAELYMNGDEYVKFGLQGDRSRFDKVKQAVKKAGIKLLLSFTNSVSNGDNARGGGFSALCKSPEMRKQFAKDCSNFIINEGLDGIDIDWEFPGMSFGGNAYDTQVDVDNFTLLMKELREAIGRNKLLTYAGYCMDVKETTDGGRRYIDIVAVDPYVDFVNIMTYDLDAAPSHQSAISSPQAYWDCERSVQAYLDAGISPSKLVLGVPFYGRAHWDSGGAIDYNKIILLSKADGYVIDNWDAEGQVPYVTKNGTFYCGYDNARSIAAKGEWIRSLGLRGMMFWDYDGDDSAGTLRHALWNAVMQ